MLVILDVIETGLLPLDQVVLFDLGDQLDLECPVYGMAWRINAKKNTHIFHQL